MKPATAALLGTILALPLAACAREGLESTPPSPAASGKCDNEGLDRFVGQKASEARGAELLAASGAKVLRWGPPGSAMTMDYREDRLTVSYDADMAITSARCG